MYSFFILCLATYNRSLFLIEKRISYRSLLLISQDKKNRKGNCDILSHNLDFLKLTFLRNQKKREKSMNCEFLTIFVTTEFWIYIVQLITRNCEIQTHNSEKKIQNCKVTSFNSACFFSEFWVYISQLITRNCAIYCIVENWGKKVRSLCGNSDFSAKFWVYMHTINKLQLQILS